jgi:hypothetical protein
MSFRKEKKFRLSKFDFDSLKINLRLNGMQSLYPKRIINTLYYDTELHSMFNDSEEGLLPRKKVRIRWYDDVRKANKEVKISSAEGRFKTSTFANVKSELTIPLSLYESSYGVIYPSLFVSYTREYFSFESMRITFDSSIQYANYRQSRKILHEDGECVMEVKTDLDVPDDYIESILPFPTARFSKYSRGFLISSGGL